MDDQQLEEYRKRMQQRYNTHKPATSQPSERVEERKRISTEEEDEKLARQLQKEEQSRLDEETARKIQSEEEHKRDVPPPAPIQRVERLIDPLPPAYPVESHRPLLPPPSSNPRARASSPRTSCWPESQTCCCGLSDQFFIWLFAAWFTAGLLTALFLFLYVR